MRSIVCDRRRRAWIPSTKLSDFSFSLRKSAIVPSQTRISFSPELERVTTVLSLEDYSQEELRNSWYSMDDYSKFKRDARKRASMVRKHFPHMVDNLNKIVTQAVDAAEENLEKYHAHLDFHAISLSSDDVRDCRLQSDYRGLERWISQMLRNRREDVRDDNEHVLQISKYSSVVETRKQSEEMTLTSRVFARMMGLIDAATVSEQ